MTNSQSQTGSAPRTSVGNLGQSWGWLLGFGVLTAIAGLAVLTWPGPTVLVLAVIFGVQLLVGGVFWFVSAAASDEPGMAVRILLAVLAVLAGIVVLRYPVQSAFLLPLVLGLFWAVNGIMETFHAVVTHTVPSRAWAITGGLLSIVAGVALLVYPAIGLLAMSWLLGFWLLVYGGITITRAAQLRPQHAAKPIPPTVGPAPA